MSDVYWDRRLDGEVFCNLHEVTAYECSCPVIEAWTRDPYETPILPPEPLPDERWWISWWANDDESAPLAWPPPDPVLGFWTTGARENAEEGLPDQASVCALVGAVSAEEATAALEEGWPELKQGGREIRFIEFKGKGRIQLGSRFPTPDWARKRIER